MAEPDFGPIPTVLVRALARAEATGHEYRLAMALCCYASLDTGIAWPSLRTLRDLTRLHGRSLDRALDGLIDKGIIEYSAGGGKRSSRYRFIVWVDECVSLAPASTRAHVAPAPTRAQEETPENLAPAFRESSARVSGGLAPAYTRTEQRTKEQGASRPALVASGTPQDGPADKATMRTWYDTLAPDRRQQLEQLARAKVSPGERERWDKRGDEPSVFMISLMFDLAGEAA